MSDFSQRIANLSPDKLKFFLKRLEKKGRKIPRAQTIPQRHDPLLSSPLSFAQERLWFLDQLEPGNPLYNLSDALYLEGMVNVVLLEQIFSEVVRRHEALRTSFATVEGQPVQVINKVAITVVSVVDLSGLSNTNQEVIRKHLAIEQACCPFDLTNGTLLRTILLKLSEDKNMLLLSMHHIISDGWSIRVFIQETIALYEMFSAGRPSPLFDLRIQYADFVEWQRQQLNDEVLETELAYWSEQLSDVPSVLELPTDRPRPVRQTFRGGYQFFKLSPGTANSLEALSTKQGVTLFMTLLAAFQTLLYRYTGQDDILVGSPIAGRNQVETEDLIGLFVNTLVFHTNMTGDPNFRELLGQVREKTLEAYSHQNLPFDKLVEALQPERSLSYTPLFQVWFVYDDSPMSSVKVPGLTIGSLETDSDSTKGMAKFDLTMSVMKTAEGLRGILGYNTDLFNTATVDRMQKHFQNLLENVAASLDQPISMLPMLTPDEEQKLLVEWNRSRMESLLAVCLHEIFEAQVERTPDAIAVVFEEEQLTYSALNRRANQLAHHLRTLDVGPEVMVGMCVERSVEMVVGLLGILKSGGGYVPLDPAYPQERLDFMLAETEVQVLLTQDQLIFGLPPHAVTSEVVCFDSDWHIIAQQSDENPVNQTNLDNLAYIIYTSGSTGEPKGVCVTHRVAVNHFVTIESEFNLTVGDRVLQFASLSFDVSLEQIFPTLCCGAKLVLRDSEVWNSINLVKKIWDYGLTVINLPPTYWCQLTQAWVANNGSFPSEVLRLVIVGGDVMLPEFVRLWQQAPMRLCRLLNAYGPTEAVITSTIFEISATDSSDYSSRRIPIGRPLAGRVNYVLDRNGALVPVGVPGELHIGGMLLASGYLNHPEFTAEKFIPNLFNDVLSPRLYKTGDLVRYLPDGNIEFLGRVDTQVKIRGFRVELGEIEAILGEHRVVREVVVLAREDVPGDKHLVAYIIAQPELTSSDHELRDFLKNKLPDHMVPQAFVWLDALPLTPNSKVDRQMLPAPENVESKQENIFVAPRSPVEEVLAIIWKEVLKLKQIDIHDNFFDLGGHSLLATQVTSRLHEIFRVDLPLRTLFEATTLAELSQAMIENEAESGQIEERARIFLRIEYMSVEEAEEMLQQTEKKGIA